MICKYCGCNTEEKDGICKACSYKLKVDPNQGGDIFSSSGAEKPQESTIAITIPEQPKVEFPVIPETKEELPSGAPTRTGEKVKGAKSKGFFIIASIIAVALIVAGLYFGGVFKTNVMKIEDHLKDGNYTAAQSMFRENFTSEGSNSLNKMLKNRLTEVYKEYCDGEREYKSALEEVAVIEKMGVTELKAQVKKAKEDISKMKESKDSFKSGEEYYSKKNYPLCIKEYAKVIKEDSNYSIAQDHYQQAASNYRNTVFQESDRLRAEGNINGAIKLLEDALKVLGKDSRISDRLKKYQKSVVTTDRNELLTNADEYAVNNNYAAAINVLLDAMENNKSYEEDEEIEEAIKEYRKDYEKYFKSKMDEYIEAEQFEEAGELLKEAGKVIPDSKVFLEQDEELDNKLPTYLDKIKHDSASDWKFGKGDAVDTFGISHSTDTNYIKLSAKSSAIYELDKEDSDEDSDDEGYKNFKFSVVAADDIDPSVKCKVKIVARKGGDYIMREADISARHEAQEIVVDIEDFNSIEISVVGEGASIIMYNARLCKN